MAAAASADHLAVGELGLSAVSGNAVQNNRFLIPPQ
jgi:hypothetical protein